jgi:hypothetical protein
MVDEGVLGRGQVEREPAPEEGLDRPLQEGDELAEFDRVLHEAGQRTAQPGSGRPLTQRRTRRSRLERVEAPRPR